MRANSLTNLGVALDYNVVSDYDKVLVVAGLASEIEELAPHANEIANLVANLPDVLTVQEASELVNNLTVKVTTLPAGSAATSELVGTEIRLGIPAGTQGVQGLQGPKGDKGDKGDIGLTGAKGPIGLTGPQGPRGLRGNDGVDGVGVEITSILNNPNKSITINFSDGTQHTTDPLKGQDGKSITVTNVVNNANGTMQINFSDGTSHTTANLTGPRGFKGDTGDHVHHISYQRSKDALGNEVGPVKPSQKGYTDTYAMWTSQEELPEMYIGEFTVYNGLNTLTAEEQAKFESIEFGATADQEAFEVPYDNTISGLLSENVQNSIDELSTIKLNLLEKGQANGVAELNANGLVPSTQLPSYVDDVIEVPDYTSLPIVGESDKIYIVVEDETSGGDTSSYRWTGTVYAMVSNTLNAADVKALYEANPDTNEYSDAEKILVDVATALATTATTLPSAINEHESDIGSMVLDTTATDLTDAINEIHGEVDAHITDTEDAHDASAISHIPGDNTYATGDELQTVIEQIDTELEDQNNRLDTLEDVDTVEGSVLKSIKDTAKNATYDNAASGLTATTLETAIDELDSVIDTHKVSTGEDHTYIDQDVTTTATPTFAGIVTEGLVDGRDVSVDGAKLDTIEENAKDDQTGAEIKALYEAELDTNAYTDAEKTKLDGLETSTQLDARDTANRDRANHTGTQLASTISDFDSAVEGTTQVALNTTKLAGIEEGATADQTAVEIEALYESNTDTNKYTDAEKSRVAVSVSLQTTAQTLPDAVNEIDSKLDALNVSRADKVLASKDVAKLIYDNGNLVKIRYTNDTDVDYEVLSYVGEDLTNVAHYVGGVLQGNTVLTYSGGNLVSSIFTGV